MLQFKSYLKSVSFVFMFTLIGVSASYAQVMDKMVKDACKQISQLDTNASGAELEKSLENIMIRIIGMFFIILPITVWLYAGRDFNH